MENTKNRKFMENKSAPKISRREKQISLKKTRLSKQAKRTKWAPVWIVLKKFGMGKRIHPSAVTRHRRNWRRTKMHIKPRRQKKSHFG